MIASDPQHGFFYPWLFDLRGIVYDGLHQFVSENGYRLADSVWRVDAETRNRIDALLEHEIRQGTAAVKVAKLLEEYLQPEQIGIRTRKPYGQWGSYSARRLARTEITAAAGRAVEASSQANPFVETIKWALSLSHEEWDCNCRANSEKDQGYGPGVYPKGQVPRYPDHPH